MPVTELTPRLVPLSNITLSNTCHEVLVLAKRAHVDRAELFQIPFLDRMLTHTHT